MSGRLYGRRGPPAASAPSTPTIEPRVRDWLRQCTAIDSQSLAVEEGDVRWSFAELDSVVGETAMWLNSKESLQGMIVAVSSRRSRWFLVELLALWDVGAIPVVIGEHWSEARRAAATANASADYLLHGRGDHRGRSLPMRYPRPPRTQEDQETLARASHVLFTSGSSAEPAAVAVGRGMLERGLQAYSNLVNLTQSDRVPFLSDPAHDPAFREVFAPLSVGATVVIPESRVVSDPSACVDWIMESRVTLVQATPTRYRLLADACSAPLEHVRLAASAGATLHPATLRAIQVTTPNAAVLNGYGCTETPQLVAALLISPGSQAPMRDASTPVGKTLPGNTIQLRAQDGSIVDTEEVGEIWVKNPVALGYVGRHASRRGFWKDSDGIRWYRTGDLATQDSQGSLTLLGRSDRQVKINGERIDLQALEAVAYADSDVVASVCAMESKQTEAVVAWIQGGSDTAERELLRERLTAEFAKTNIPIRMVMVNSLPTTDNGKPLAPFDELSPETLDLAFDDCVANIVRIGGRLLGRPLRSDHNFFDAGLSSLMLMQLSIELELLWKRQIPVLMLFKAASAERLATALIERPEYEQRAPLRAALSSTDVFALEKTVRQQVRADGRVSRQRLER